MNMWSHRRLFLNSIQTSNITKMLGDCRSEHLQITMAPVKFAKSLMS
jgi:hypothetical protein